jgi:hypothetical protein
MSHPLSSGLMTDPTSALLKQRLEDARVHRPRLPRLTSPLANRIIVYDLQEVSYDNYCPIDSPITL